MTRLHHPEAVNAVGQHGGAAAEEEEQEAAADEGVTFEEDDDAYASGFRLFVNNPLFSDVALRVSDDRVYSGHRVLLMGGNPYFAAILRPFGWGSGAEGRARAERRGRAGGAPGSSRARRDPSRRSGTSPPRPRRAAAAARAR